MIGGVATLASRFGFKRGWMPSLWTSFAVFVTALIFLAAIRPSVPAPDLESRILATAYGGRIASGAENDKVIIISDIRNAGSMPSSVINIVVTATINGKTFPGESNALPKSLSMESNGKEVTYNSSDALYNKFSHKIDIGDDIAGILLISFPQVSSSELKFGDVTLTMDITDIKGRITHAEQKLRDKNSTSEMQLFPGLNPAFRVQNAP